MGDDVQKMVAVGLVWGVTNALMRRGAQIWDRRLHDDRHKSKKKEKEKEEDHHHHHHQHQRSNGLNSLLLWWWNVRKWVELVTVWQYSLPFAVNLSASAAFFHILADAPISVAVPVTNATTFASTAVAAMLLGEETHLGYALLGTASMVLGVCLCCVK